MESTRVADLIYIPLLNLILLHFMLYTCNYNCQVTHIINLRGLPIVCVYIYIYILPVVLYGCETW